MRTVLFVCALAIGCGGDDDPGGLDDAQPVIDNYATIVHASYDASLTAANALKVAVDAFVADPNATTLAAAREAWLDAREPYGQTESYRFYDGPIDNAETGPEGQINAWPLDEVYIDYVDGMPMSGIVNDPTMFPTLSIAILAERNEEGGEKNISTGYHAVEFLLWGQDLSMTGPGARPHTDYVDGAMGTAMNQDRRGQYLALAAELLVQDLTSVRDAWAPGATNYAASFTAEAPAEAVRRMLQGMGSLSGAELAGERMTTALDNRDQEDEHSCFSDNTHRDIYLNALAVENVYLGRFGTMDGPGIDDLVIARDPALDMRLKMELTAALTAIQAIPPPFDQALVTDSSRSLIMTAINALRDATDTIVEVATLLGIALNLE